MTQGRILVVDDEKDIGIIVQKGLSMAGFDVTVETDPIAAFKKFKPNAYDLVILDQKMPDVSGLELYQKLFEVDPKIKVCFFSAFDTTLKDRFAKEHPNSKGICFIEKPVAIAKLVEIVRSEILSAR